MFFTWDWYTFVLVILALIAISLVILGIMTAYFGSGKSRIVGIILLVVGVVVGLLTFAMTRLYMEPSGGLWQGVIEPTIFYVVATGIGVAIGLLIFLGAIMKT
ncbi:MAG: hypothetical protein M1151_07475 [Candidatus Thermoplasmatota archaeon]|jgi:hypothetical protein|nr:hypothetical protein [Candidatus Thermoplasmatota archaeon]MCL5786484.1 hypothetical protein [Candidatus Thermoplasmatota archaeon]